MNLHRGSTVADLDCPECGDRLTLHYYKHMDMCGVTLEGLRRIRVPIVLCARASCGLSWSTSCEPFRSHGLRNWTLPWDRCGLRYYSRSVTEFLCRELRVHYNSSRLPQALAARMTWRGLAGERAAEVQMIATMAMPRPPALLHIVLCVFQRDERPGLERLAWGVIAKFGLFLSADGGSAPLQEMRTYTRGNAVQPLCACMKATGLFDVQLLPNIYAAQENAIELMVLFSFISYVRSVLCPGALPIGMVDDATEHSFKKSMKVIEKISLGLPTSSTGISVDYAKRKVGGFFRGIDTKTSPLEI